MRAYLKCRLIRCLPEQKISETLMFWDVHRLVSHQKERLKKMKRFTKAGQLKTVSVYGLCVLFTMMMLSGVSTAATEKKF